MLKHKKGTAKKRKGTHAERKNSNNVPGRNRHLLNKREQRSQDKKFQHSSTGDG